MNTPSNGRSRSFLFVPATSARKVDKAFSSQADAVIVDLEDAVAVSEKDAAREAIAPTATPPRNLPCWIRVNALDTPYGYPDLLAVGIAGVSGVVLPKVETGEQLRTADWLLGNLERQRGLAPRGIALLAIIETARGLRNADDIAGGSPRLRRIMFGAVDLAADVGINPNDDQSIAQARFSIACASRAAGLEPPVDTAYTDIHNLGGLSATTRRAKALGFTAKACIHPVQIDVVNQVFTPTADEVAWAERVVAAFGDAERQGVAAVMLDGQMLDYPVIEKARRVLAQA